MYEHDAILERGQALEDEYFFRVDTELKNQIRQSLERDQAKSTLQKMTGFHDESLIHHLIDAGFQPTTIAALGLVPLVFVAWADGRLTDAERATVVDESLHRGLADQPDAMRLVSQWLQRRPPESLWLTWEQYVRAVMAITPGELGTLLQTSLLNQATLVAKASGGALGMYKICRAEQEVLDRIKQVFKSVGQETVDQGTVDQ